MHDLILIGPRLMGEAMSLTRMLRRAATSMLARTNRIEITRLRSSCEGMRKMRKERDDDPGPGNNTAMEIVVE